jgi:hypothetical protein
MTAADREMPCGCAATLCPQHWQALPLRERARAKREGRAPAFDGDWRTRPDPIPQPARTRRVATRHGVVSVADAEALSDWHEQAWRSGTDPL